MAFRCDASMDLDTIAKKMLSVEQRAQEGKSPYFAFLLALFWVVLGFLGVVIGGGGVALMFGDEHSSPFVVVGLNVHHLTENMG